MLERCSLVHGGGGGGERRGRRSLITHTITYRIRNTSTCVPTQLRRSLAKKKKGRKKENRTNKIRSSIPLPRSETSYEPEYPPPERYPPILPLLLSRRTDPSFHPPPPSYLQTTLEKLWKTVDDGREGNAFRFGGEAVMDDIRTFLFSFNPLTFKPCCSPS